MLVLAVQSPIEAICRELMREPLHPGRRSVVLVASERHAHAIRRHLGVELGRPEHLAGVWLPRPLAFACEMLARAGRVRRPGWEEMRRLRILELFETGSIAAGLRYFNAVQLRSGQGYVDAFARTIADLEASGLTAAQALRLSEPLGADDPLAAARLHDVALTWQAADAHQGLHASTAQLFTQAAALVAAQPSLTAPFGPVFAVLTRSPAAVVARFLGALPNCRLAFHDARPLRAGTQRWRALIGMPAAPAPAAAGDGGDPERATMRRAGADAVTELQIVQAFLFERPEVLTDPQRPRSRGSDGTVDFEEYASIEDEIEAAAGWVGEQIAAGTPLERTALIVPEIDPYAAALVDRLQRLVGGDDGAGPWLHVAGGLPLATTPAGMRLQAVLHALARGLDAEATIRILPSLRRAEQAQDDPHTRLSPSRAAEIVYGAGIVGGSTGDKDGVREWTARLGKRHDILRTLLAEAEGAQSDTRRSGFERQDAQRWLKDVEPILPAIAALQHCAEAVLGDEALATLWPALQTFAGRWLRVPPQPPNLLAILEQRLQPILASPAASAIRGASALRYVMDLLRRERWQTSRFGEPCIFIGTPAQAAGLPFAAVRILGLAEGALPHTPHDDPIVPDALRGRIEEAAPGLDLEGVVISRLADRVLDDLHNVWRVVSGVRQTLALSVPRQWVDRSDREVSGILLEAATALGRPVRQSGDEGDVPTAARLRAVYLNAGRDARAAAAAAQPLSPRARLAAIATGSDASGATASASARLVTVPANWTGESALAVDRIWHLSSLEATALGVMDGIVAETWDTIVPPGLRPERPISATGLLGLLVCPHRFLLERILYFKERASRPATDLIPPILYGSLFHAAAERFFAEAGAPLCRGEGALDHWLARARAIADDEFEARRHAYPLRSTSGVEHERTRLRRQIEQLVHYEWQAARRQFVASELAFGEPEPVALLVDGGTLYLRGAIDRVDQIGPATLSVRDLKTGRVRDLNEEGVNVTRDLQLGVYVLVLEAARAAAGGEERVTHAAYVHPSAAQEPDRAFDGAGLDLLRRHTRAWLRVAHQLLSTGSFPRTPNTDDCTFCPFVAACGDGAQANSQGKLAALPPGHVLEGFVHLKRQRALEDA